jgi:sugar lactone lactonase YvrE
VHATAGGGGGYLGFSAPSAVAIAPNGTFALVANTGGNNVGRINLATNEVTFPYAGFDTPSGVALSPDCRFALVANTGKDNVGMIDLLTREVTFPHVGLSAPTGVAIAPDGTFALVTHTATYCSDTLERIDLLTKKITLPCAGSKCNGDFSNPSAISIAPNGRFALTTNTGDNTVGRIDLVTNEVTFPYIGFDAPCGIAIAPNGKFALVTNKDSGIMSQISGDLQSGFNGTHWLGQWVCAADELKHVESTWMQQWGSGFVHALPGIADARTTPVALPALPDGRVPRLAPGVLDAAAAKKSPACTVPGCPSRPFGLLVKRHHCTLCGTAVCSTCSKSHDDETGRNCWVRCRPCQRLVLLPRWSVQHAEVFAAAIRAEANSTPLVVRTLGGDRHVVAGGSGWATAVDLRQAVVGACPELGALGDYTQLVLMCGTDVVDPFFFTSETRARMARGELAAELIIAVCVSGAVGSSALGGGSGGGGDGDGGDGGDGGGGGSERGMVDG